MSDSDSPDAALSSGVTVDCAPRQPGEIRAESVGDPADHRQFKHHTKKGRVTIPGKLSWESYPELERSILRQAGLIGDGK